MSAVADSENDPALSSSDRDAYARFHARAAIGVPLVKGGRFAALLAVNHIAPRRWSESELALTKEAAERTWSAIQRAQAEEALRDSEERFREFGEASADVLWIRNAKTLDWEYLSKGFEQIYAMLRDQALAGDTMRNWLDLIVPEDRETARECLERVRHGERTTYEYRIRRPSDGSVRWLRNTDFPMRDSSSNVVWIGGIGSDITALKAAQEHQRILLAELQHRVRNTLAVVRSIAQRTARNSTSADDMLAHFQGRLDAFSRVQAALTRSADQKVDLRSLVEDELRAHATSDGRGVRIEGPRIALQAKAAEKLSLAIHELTTNAVKHGALRNDGGRLEVRWTEQQRGNGPELVLNWQEFEVEGITAHHRQGFGMELLTQSLPFDVQGTVKLELAPGGVRFALRMPLLQN